MTFGWLKQYMPRSIFGRTALILAVPLVLLQVVVMVVFFQRHFEDVTAQMTQSIIRELRLVQESTAAATSPAEAQAAMAPMLPTLGLSIAFLAPGEVPAEDSRRWYDFSGITVISTLRQNLPETLAVSLWEDRQVMAYIQTPFGPARITFPRRWVSATAPHQLLVIMLGFGIVFAGVSIVYLRNQLRPVKRLADAATAFGRGRNVPYAPSGAVELRAAGHAFLDMRARIERQIEQRTLMLSGVSHDMRTPLTRLRLGLAMMDPDEAAPLLSDVAEMEALVTSFLDFAKTAAAAEPEPVDVVGLVRDVVANAERAGQAVTLARVEGGGTVMLRGQAIRRALENLIGNAVRYGTRAQVSLVVTDRRVRLRVDDDGPGIPDSQRAEALKPFARLDPSRNQNAGSGVGLGLAIANDTARMHGGALRLGHSETLGGLAAEIVIER